MRLAQGKYIRWKDWGTSGLANLVDNFLGYIFRLYVLLPRRDEK